MTKGQKYEMGVTEGMATNIIDAAENGNRVAVIVPDRESGNRAMETIIEAIDPATAYQVARTGQRIRINGYGLITFHAARQLESLKDIEAEQIYIDEVSAQNKDIFAAALPGLVSGGEIVRYAS